jgi:RecB family exonuclease
MSIGRNVSVYCRAKAQKLRESLWNDYSPGQSPHFCIVYPTGRQMRHARRQILQRVRLIPGGVIMSKKEFEDRLLANCPYKLYTTDALPPFIHLAMQEGGSGQRLRARLMEHLGAAWSDSLDRLPAGVLTRIANDVATLRGNAALPVSQRVAVPGAEALQRFANELDAVLDETKGRHRDRALLDVWAGAAPSFLNALLPGVTDVILDGLVTLDPSDWVMLRWFDRKETWDAAAPSQAPPLRLHLLFDYAPGAEADRFPHIHELWRDLGDEVHSAFLCDSPSCACADGGRPGAVQISVQPDPLEEARAMAGAVRQFLASGRSADRVAICVPNPADYAPLVRTAFRDFGVPYRIAPSVPLTATPAWEFLGELADAIAAWQSTGLPLTVVGSLCEQPWLRRIGLKAGVHPADVRRAQSVFPDVTTLEMLVAQGAKNLRRADVVDEDGDVAVDSDEEAGAAENRQVEWWKTARPRFEALLEWLRQFRQPQSREQWAATISTQFAGVYARLVIFNTDTRYQEDHPFGRTADDLRYTSASVAQIIAVARQFGLLANQFHNQNAISFEACVEELSLLAASVVVAEHIRTETGIEITTPVAAFGGDFDLVLMAGMIEGQFPQLRMALWKGDADTGEVKDLARQLSRQRFIFERVLCSAQQAVLMYPRLISEAETLPSAFLELLAERAENGFDELQSGKTERASALARWQRLAEVLSEPAGATKLASAPGTLPPEIENCAWHVAVDQRRAAAALTEFEGIVTAGGVPLDVLEKMAAQRLFSATTLEQLVHCPLRFFFEQVLKVAPPQSEQIKLGGELGLIVHRVLFRFMDAMRAQSFELLRQNRLADATRILVRIVCEELQWLLPTNDSRRLALAWQLLGKDRLLALATEEDGEAQLFSTPSWREAVRHALESAGRAEGRLMLFLKDEMARWRKNDDGELPVLLEWQFGTSTVGRENEIDPASQDEPVRLMGGSRAFQLRGKIDRVDARRTQGRFVVIDYKTGSTLPSWKSVRELEAIQLPLYAAAIEVARPVGLEACEDVAYYRIGRNKAELKPMGPGVGETIEGVCRRAGEAVEQFAKGTFFALLCAKPTTDGARCARYGGACPFYLKSCFGHDDAQLVAKVRLAAPGHKVGGK